MSLRKSLYKQHSRSANSSSSSYVNLCDAGVEERHWVRDWYDPPKSIKEFSLVQQQGAVPGQNQSGLITPLESTPQPMLSQSQTPQPSKTFGYKIRTWVVADAIEPVEDCLDEKLDTYIDLSEYEYLTNSSSSKDLLPSDDTGLSKADIKSAVGGAGTGSSLFSSSAAHAMKEPYSGLTEGKVREEINTSDGVQTEGTKTESPKEERLDTDMQDS